MRQYGAPAGIHRHPLRMVRKRRAGDGADGGRPLPAGPFGAAAAGHDRDRGRPCHSLKLGGGRSGGAAHGLRRERGGGRGQRSGGFRLHLQAAVQVHAD